MSLMEDTGAATGCPSHFRLDRLAAGELGHAESAVLLLHVESCDRCRLRRSQRFESEALYTTDPALLQRLETTVAAPPIRTRRAPRWSHRVVAWSVGAVLGFLALLMFPGPTGTEMASWDGTRTKGSSRSALYVVDEGRVRAATGMFVIHPGSTLQVTVSSPEPSYAAVVSMDGAGRRSIYVPHEGDDTRGGMVELPAGRDMPLPQSTITDDVLGTETVAVFICRQRLADPGALLEVATVGEAPAGCVVERYTLEKRERP